MIDRETAIQWATESGLKAGKGPILFDHVTTEQIQNLVNRAADEVRAQCATHPSVHEPLREASAQDMAAYLSIADNHNKAERSTELRAQMLKLRGLVQRVVQADGTPWVDLIKEMKEALEQTKEDV